MGRRDHCWLCFGSQVLLHQQLLRMSGFSSPRHQKKGLFPPHIKRLQSLASALRFPLPGLVKRLRSAQTREINLLHLLSKIMDSRLQRKRKSLCFVAYLSVRPDPHPLHRCKSQCGKQRELICLGIASVSGWDTSGAREALQRGKKGCLHLGWCWGWPGLHALPEGDFYGAIVVISKHEFFHVPNIVEGSNSAPCLLLQ